MQISRIIRSQPFWNRTTCFLFLWIHTVLSCREHLSGNFLVQPSQRSKFHGNQQNYQHKYLFIPNSILDKKVPQYLWPSKSPISKSTNFSNDVQHEIPKFFITFMQISTKTVNSQVHSNQIPDYYLLQNSSTNLLPSEAHNYNTFKFSNAVQRYIQFFNNSSPQSCKMQIRSNLNNQQHLSHYNAKSFQPQSAIEWLTISSATNKAKSNIFQNSTSSTSLRMPSDTNFPSNFSTSLTMITVIQGDGSSTSTSSSKHRSLAKDQRFENTTDTSSFPWVSVHRTTQELQRYSILSPYALTSQSFLCSYGQFPAPLNTPSRRTLNTIPKFCIHSDESIARQPNPDSTSNCTYTRSPTLTTTFMEQHRQHSATRNRLVTNFLSNSSASVYIAQSASRLHSPNFIPKLSGNLQHASHCSYHRSLNFTTLSSGQQGLLSLITRNRIATNFISNSSSSVHTNQTNSRICILKRSQDLRQYHVTTLYMYDTPPLHSHFPFASGPASYTPITTTQLYVTVPPCYRILNYITVRLQDSLRQFSSSTTAYIYSTFDLAALAFRPNLRTFQPTTARSKFTTTVLRHLRPDGSISNRPSYAKYYTSLTVADDTIPTLSRSRIQSEDDHEFLAGPGLRTHDDGGQDAYDRLQITLLRILTVTVMQTCSIIVNTFNLSDTYTLKTRELLDNLLEGTLESGHNGWNLIDRFIITFILTLYYTDMILELMLENFSNYYPVLQRSDSRPQRHPEFTFYLLVIARIAPINRHIDMNITLTCEPTLSYDKGTAYS